MKEIYYEAGVIEAMNKNMIKIGFILILGYLIIRHADKFKTLANSIIGGATKGIQTFQGEDFEDHE